LAVGNIYGTLAILLNNLGPHHTTTTALVSWPNPSAYGQEVTLTATVSSATGTPTGTVSYFDGEKKLASATLENGTASFSAYWLALGPHSITAKYEGSMQFSVSLSNTINHDVNIAATKTVLSSLRSPNPPNQPVTLYVTVSAYRLPPTGQVTIREGATVVATLTLTNGWARYKTLMPKGVHVLTASYSGDVNDTGSTSETLAQYIGWFPVRSATVVTSSQPRSLLGQPVTFTATINPINPPYGNIPDGELVTFYDGKTVLGLVPLVSGSASYTTSLLKAKIHHVKAVYAGDSLFEPSEGAVSQVVEKYATTTTLTSTPNPAHFGNTVTFNAHVTGASPNAPTGKVKFVDDGLLIGSATLNDGFATLTNTKLLVGTHRITAQYVGDTVNADSISPVLNQVVQ
jgi:hypothetical protein